MNNKTVGIIAAIAVALIFGLLIGSLTIIFQPRDPIEEPVTETDTDEQSDIKRPFYDVSPYERELLARLVWNESGTCSVECQAAITSVVFNMLAKGNWGNTIEEVVYHKNSFVGALYIETATPNARTYEAVDKVINNGVTIPGDVCYFRNQHHFEWDGYEGVMDLDNVYFGHFVNGSH